MIVLDQGQGGAQGLEDGLVIGLVMVGATNETVEERLAVYQRVRHHRASAIQILSNYGFDQKPPEEVMEYLEGQSLPSEYSSPTFVAIKFCPVTCADYRNVASQRRRDISIQLPCGYRAAHYRQYEGLRPIFSGASGFISIPGISQNAAKSSNNVTLLLGS